MNTISIPFAGPRRLVLLAFSILAALAILPSRTLAWNQVGHRLIAELTWRKLSPDERRIASALLQEHPHYRQLLAADVPKGVDRNEWAFLTAAVWPDMVRPAKHGDPAKPEWITKYDLYPHAIGYPFLGRGETNRALLESFYIADPNAEMVLSNSLATLKIRDAEPGDRSVRLCWVMHLMGDLHQPLHAANRVTSENRRGEGLGGDHFVLDPGGKRVNLHAFWDQLPGTAPSYQAVAVLADSLEAAPALKANELADYRDHRTIASWVQESFRIAVDFAYAEDRIQLLHSASGKVGKFPTSAIPTMTAAYVEGSRDIARHRLILAAQRLADELKQVW